jgi:hypothetical protein
MIKKDQRLGQYLKYIISSREISLTGLTKLFGVLPLSKG